MRTNAEWIFKHGITAIVVPIAYHGPYTSKTYATKFRYKEGLGLYNGYKEHMQYSVKILTSCFTEGLLIDLETDGEVIGYTAIIIY